MPDRDALAEAMAAERAAWDAVQETLGKIVDVLDEMVGAQR